MNRPVLIGIRKTDVCELSRFPVNGDRVCGGGKGYAGLTLSMIAGGSGSWTDASADKHASSGGAAHRTVCHLESKLPLWNRAEVCAQSHCAIVSHRRFGVEQLRLM